MAMTAADGLIIQLAADVARLRADMNEANRVVQGGASTMSSAMGGLKNMIGGLVAGLSVGAFAGWINGAIDAADATKEFSQKTGVAIKDVAGLQLGFRQGSVESEALLGSIAKLSKNMAEGSDTFKKMGIETRNADGTLRNVKDVIYDVADASQRMGNTTERTVMLQDLFGKSAQALIPTLDGGSEGLRDMADMAERLGLVIDDKTANAADQFGDTIDLLHDSSKGMATQMAAHLLPTLNSIAGAMLNTEDKSDNLKIAADALSVVLKTLYTAGVLVAGAIKTVGGNIGATAAAIMTAIKGDFSGAANIMKERANDVEKEWKTRLKSISDVWKETSNSTVSAVAAMNAEQKKGTIQTKEQEAAVKDADKAYDTFKNGLVSYRNELKGQLVEGEKLSKAQKVLADLAANNTDEVKKLSSARRAELIVLAKENVEYENQAKAVDEATKANKKLRDELINKNRTIDDEIRKQKQSNAEVMGGKEASEKLEIAKLREQAAIADSNAAKAIESGLNKEISGEYTAQAEKLRELADLKEQGIHVKAAKDSADEWKKTTDSIGEGVIDALMRGFESGKGFAQNFKETLVNMFKTMVLQPTLKAAVGGIGNIAGNIGSKLGMTQGNPNSGSMLGQMGSMGVWGLAAAGAVAAAGVWNKSQAAKLKEYSASYRQNAQSTGTVLGMDGAQSQSLSKALGSLGDNSKSLLDVNNGMYQALLAIQDGIAGTASGFAKQIGLNGSGVSGIKTGTTSSYQQFGMGNVGETLGNGVFGKAGAMMTDFMKGLGNKISTAIYNTKTSISDSGIEFDGANLAALMGGEVLKSRNYADVQKVKKVLGVNVGQSVKTQTSELDPVVQAQLSSVFVSAGQAMKIAAKAFGKDGEQFVKSLTIDSQKLSLKGLTGDALTKQIEAFFSTNLDKWSKSLVGDTEILSQFQEIGEGAFQTVVRLASQIASFDDNAKKLNLNFHEVGIDAIATSQALADMAGGFDSLQKSMDSYYNNFYSEDEKVANSAVKLHNALEEIGVTSMPRTREEFRKLVEAQDITTESGAKMFTNLMNVQGVFAELVPSTLRLSASLSELNQLNGMGGIFSDIASTSIEARESIINLAGGIDALISSANQFVADYYSDDEQAGMTAKSTLAQLKALGLDGSNLSTKEDFRSLVESIGGRIGDESAQQQLVGLLQLGPQFAQLSEYLKTNNTDLVTAAANAPQTAILQNILDSSSASTTSQENLTASVDKLDATMSNVGDRIVNAISGMSTDIISNQEEYYRKTAMQSMGY